MNADQSPPVACRMSALTAGERERRAVLVSRVAEAQPAVEELADGYVLHFENRPGIEDVIRELMPLEETCCPFLVLDFTELDPNACAFRLRGPEGAKAIIADAFGLK